MKLIFDQNLSSDLVRQLAALFPGSVHVAGAKRGGAKRGRCQKGSGRCLLVFFS
jgi:hypothetical protein